VIISLRRGSQSQEPIRASKNPFFAVDGSLWIIKGKRQSRRWQRGERSGVFTGLAGEQKKHSLSLSLGKSRITTETAG